MVSLSIPDKFKKGQDIPFTVSGNAGAAADTFRIVDEDGNQVKFLGSFTKDNDFGKKIKGKIENADSTQYILEAFGPRMTGSASNPRMLYDKQIAEFKSNVAEVLPSMNNSNSSNGSDQKTSKIKKYVPLFLGITGMIGLYRVFGGDE